MMPALGRHLLESTLFALVVGLVVLLVHKRGAAARYLLWLVAAAKFAVPASFFLWLGRNLYSLVPVKPVAASLSTLFFHLASPEPAFQLAEQAPALFNPLILIWPTVASILLVIWLRQIWASRALLKHSADPESDSYLQLQRRVGSQKELRLRFSDSVSEPVLVGFWKPAVLIPANLRQTLSPAELDSVILHELAHAKRHDNWTSAFAHIVSCVFWFYPLLWWIEKRLHRERELACDEMVVRCGMEPESYVTAILKVCRSCLNAGVAGISGVGGSNLKDRMEAIMSLSLNAAVPRAPRTLVGGLIAAAVVLPFTLGFFSASSGFGQTANAAAQTPGGLKAESAVRCAFGGVEYPEGTVILEGDGPQQMCSRALNPADSNNLDAPLSYHSEWIRTSETIRARSAKVVQLSEPPVAVCAPTGRVQKGLCSCEDGGKFSPGANANSAKGSFQLRCGKDGNWIQTKTPNVNRD